MNVQTRRCHRSAVLLATVFASLTACAGPSPRAVVESAEPASDGLVECRLPPQIRKLGRNLPYLAAGRQIRTTASDCRIRGGESRAMATTSASTTPPDAAAALPTSVAVTVGGDPAAPACPASGQVTGLRGGSTLGLRSGPGTGFTRLGGLANGQALRLCDRSGDGEWIGVLIPARAGDDCGVAAPSADQRAYDGACRQGWVNAQWVREQS